MSSGLSLFFILHPEFEVYRQPYSTTLKTQRFVSAANAHKQVLETSRQGVALSMIDCEPSTK